MNIHMLLTWMNLALRGLMEFGIVIAFAQWGFHIGKTEMQRIFLSIAAPITVFSFWSLFDFRGVVSTPEPFRLVQEMVISLLAAVAWYAAGQRSLGWFLAVISVVHHVMVYALGYRLLK